LIHSEILLQKGKNATQAAKKICDVLDIMQYVWHKADSSIFDLEILMSKMHFALVDSQWKVDEIEKVGQDGTLAW